MKNLTSILYIQPVNSSAQYLGLGLEQPLGLRWFTSNFDMPSAFITPIVSSWNLEDGTKT